jgi:hypothetical protein
VYKVIKYEIVAVAAPVSELTVIMDKASPHVAGTAVNFYAAASGGSGRYEYYFKLYNPNTQQWSIGQAYSTKGTWNWDTSGLAPGIYTIEVRTRNLGTDVNNDVYKVIKYEIVAVAAPVSELTVIMDKASPHVAGTAVNFYAAASGGSGRYEYYFKLYNPNTRQWSIGQAYSTMVAWTWDTAGLAPGIYTIEVRTRNVGTDVNNDVYKVIKYEILAAAPVSELTVTMDKASPQVAGASVNFMATALETAVITSTILPGTTRTRVPVMSDRRMGPVTIGVGTPRG